MRTVDPKIQARIKSILSEPGAEVALVGKRSAWQRYGSKLVAAAAVGVALHMGSSVIDRAINGEPMQMLEQKPQRVHWLEMPSSPFLEAARSEDGAYSMERALAAYSAAGLTPEQAVAVVHRLEALSPVVMGVEDKALEKRFIEEARHAASALSEEFPAQEKFLVNMLASGKGLKSAHFNYLENLDWVPVVSAWSDLGATETNLLSEASEVEGITMEGAKEALEDAVKITGLRALRAVPEQLASPASIQRLAVSLEEANHDLMDATGLEGQVLGLGGRLMLKMGRPPGQTSAAGMAYATNQGDITLHAEWNNLAHEWLHGLEYLAVQRAYKHPRMQGFEGQSSSGIVDKKVVDAFTGTYQRLVDLSPSWQAARSAHVGFLKESGGAHAHAELPSGKRVQIDETGYWSSSVEGLAFAFQAHVGNNDPVVLGIRHAGRETYRMPGADEVEAHSKVWPEFFAKIAHLRLTEPYRAPALSAEKVSPDGFWGRLLQRQTQRAQSIDQSVPPSSASMSP